MSNAFITGSRAYGQPSEDSDLDLVILLTEEERAKLTALSDSGKEPIKYGSLNIIAVCSQKRYDLWKKGTDELIQLKEDGLVPTREQAITYFDTIFEKNGMCRSEDDSGE